MKKIFPELYFIELTFDHLIYHQNFDFNEGLPKIHQHDENSWQRLFTVRSLPDDHHPVHGTLGNQDIYDSWNCQVI